jgi:protein-disulfide isomerase
MRRILVLAISALFVIAQPRHCSAQQLVDQAELLKPGPFEEHALGDANAPVTIVEYASLTCHHCENFHKSTWPSFRQNYVDTGKVRFILRAFPFDTAGAAGAMLARCAGDKWHDVVDLLFQTANGWAHSNTPLNALADLMQRNVGMSRQAFETCLRDQQLLDRIAEVQKRANSVFGVTSTPTFFVNGRRHVGAPSYPELVRLVEEAIDSR